MNGCKQMAIKFETASKSVDLIEAYPAAFPSVTVNAIKWPAFWVYERHEDGSVTATPVSERKQEDVMSITRKMFG